MDREKNKIIRNKYVNIFYI